MSKKYQDRDETNRSHFVNVRLSDDEWEQLNIICELLNENRSKYIRRRIFTRRIPRPVFQYALDEATSKAVTGQLGKIGSNLNQIARKLNSGEQADNQDGRNRKLPQRHQHGAEEPQKHGGLPWRS